MIELKKGASFRIAFKAESPEEWSKLYPADYFMGQIRFEERSFELEVSVDPLAMVVYVKSETDDWPIGEGEFDLKSITGDLIQAFPELVNIKVTVLDGPTA